MSSIAFAQEGNAVSVIDSTMATRNTTITTKTDAELKHQIGIGISKFVNAAFPSDSNAFLVEYRYLTPPKIAYRAGGDYRVDSSKDSSYEFALKIGVDWLFKDYKHWKFYYGIDLWGRYLYYKDRKQHFTNLAVNPFLGIQYQITKNFSVCTEPGFFVKYNINKDNKTFDPNNRNTWVESRSAKIGFIQLNFHF